MHVVRQFTALVPILMLTEGIFTSCGDSLPLTASELAKLDAPLQLLVTTKDTPDDQRVVVLIHSSHPDELRSEGVEVDDIVENIITAKVTISQLKRIVLMSSVQSVESNSKRSPQ
jgi:predicted sugar kinase